MTGFRSFEEMDVWKESRALTTSIREICKRGIVLRDWSFADQITRSARSISANIAEGSDSMTVPEFIQSLGYAKRSAAETRSHLYDALDEKYISEQEFDRLSDLCKKICSMLAKLIHHLQKSNLNLKRTYKRSDE